LAIAGGVAQTIGNLAQPIVDTGKSIATDILNTELLKGKIKKANEQHAQSQDSKGKLANCGTSTCDRSKNLACSFGLKKDEFNNDINEGVCVEKGRTRVYGELCNETAECTDEWMCLPPKVPPPFSFQAPKVATKICSECHRDDDCTFEDGPGQFGPGRCEEGNSNKKVCKRGQRKKVDAAFAECVSPFIFADQVFTGCTKVGRHFWQSSWCPTKVNEYSRYTVDEGYLDKGFITNKSKNWIEC